MTGGGNCLSIVMSFMYHWLAWVHGWVERAGRKSSKVRKEGREVEGKTEWRK